MKTEIFHVGKCKFFTNQMQREKFNHYAMMDASFRNCFTKDLTLPLKEELERRCKSEKKENHSVLGITGETGIGKSILSVSFGAYFDDDFDCKNFFWENQDILDNLKTFKSGDFIIRDESPEQFGTGSRRIQSNLNMVIETLRKAGINFIFLGAIDREISTAHWYLEVLQQDPINRVLRVGIRENKNMTYLGYCKIKVVDEDNPLWIEYNRQKDIFMQKVKNQQVFENNPDNWRDKFVSTGEDWKALKKAERVIYLKKHFPNRTQGEYKEMATILNMMIDRLEI